MVRLQEEACGVPVEGKGDGGVGRGADAEDGDLETDTQILSEQGDETTR